MQKKVLAVIEDLFFTVKINESAKHAGLTAEFVKSEIDAIDRAKLQPSVIVIDLNCAAIDPLRLIGELKSSPELKGISVLGFVSHVQGELKQSAQEAAGHKPAGTAPAKACASPDRPRRRRSRWRIRARDARSAKDPRKDSGPPSFLHGNIGITRLNGIQESPGRARRLVLHRQDQ